MYTTVGTCSICGGPVVIPTIWHGIIPPTPMCQYCGAHAAQHGPVIPMTPNNIKITYTGNTGTPKLEDIAQDSGTVPKGKSLLID